MIKSVNSKTELTQHEIALLKYTFLCFLTDGSKFLIMYLLFHLLSLSTDYLISLGVLLSIRNFTGGIHLKHYSSCLLFTFSFVSSVIFLSHSIAVNENIQIMTLLMMIPIVFIVGPVTCSKRPKLSEQQSLIYKSIACCILGIYTSVFICTKTIPYQNLMYWGIVFQIIQLVVAKLIKERRTYNEKI